MYAGEERPGLLSGEDLIPERKRPGEGNGAWLCKPRLIVKELKQAAVVLFEASDSLNIQIVNQGIHDSWPGLASAVGFVIRSSRPSA